jgi:hypothetical protein
MTEMLKMTNAARRGAILNALSLLPFACTTPASAAIAAIPYQRAFQLVCGSGFVCGIHLRRSRRTLTYTCTRCLPPERHQAQAAEVGELATDGIQHSVRVFGAVEVSPRGQPLQSES